MDLIMKPLSETMRRARSTSSASDPGMMDDQDHYTFGSSTSSSSGDSPKTHSEESSSPPSGSFDLSYLLSIANPESSSSESQSQGSRSGSPSDWQSSIWPDLSPSGNGPWKWQPGDFSNEVIIDPASLHFAPLMSDTEMFSQPGIDAFSIDSLPSFTFTDTSAVQPSYPVELPIQYSASSVSTPYGVSMPPGLGPTPQNVQGNDFHDVGRRAREAAGVQYAIPLDAAPPTSSQPARLPLASVTPMAAQPTPLSTQAASLSPAPAPPAPSPAPSSARPKTSHTTIERRYRTNLNARIVALRHAVPALRILDKAQFPDEKVDERGYVDGVKAARKASKGNILGKAAEYIQ